MPTGDIFNIFLNDDNTQKRKEGTASKGPKNDILEALLSKAADEDTKDLSNE